MIKVNRALISVSDKKGLIPFAKGLQAVGVEILSTGRTAKHLLNAGIPVREVSDYTKLPEMLASMRSSTDKTKPSPSSPSPSPAEWRPGGASSWESLQPPQWTGNIEFPTALFSSYSSFSLSSFFKLNLPFNNYQ